MMATSPVKQWHCGTYVTGYLQDGADAHPSRLGEEVDATVCFHDGSDPCWRSRTIKIKKCNNYFIYKLPNTPNCALGYCGKK